MSNSEVFKPSLIRNAWRNELVKMNYNTLATLQPPMRNRYMMDSRLKHFSEHQRIDGLFYSVEYNADKKSGYHIHLMFKDLCNLSKEKKECTAIFPINGRFDGREYERYFFAFLRGWQKEGKRYRLEYISIK